jgi:hypothetical protein
MSIINLNKSVAIAALLALAACASPPKVRVDKDTSVNFASYKTFSWLGASKSAPPAAATATTEHSITPEGNSIAENRVRTAVIAALQAKGYSLSEANPDFRVSYVLNVYEHHKDSGMRIGLGAGGSSGNMGGGVGLSIPVGKTKNLMGAMTIDVIDSAKNAQVWTGSYEQQVASDGLSDENANKIATTILSRFPNDPGKKK